MRVGIRNRQRHTESKTAKKERKTCRPFHVSWRSTYLSICLSYSLSTLSTLMKSLDTSCPLKIICKRYGNRVNHKTFSFSLALPFSLLSFSPFLSIDVSFFSFSFVLFLRLQICLFSPVYCTVIVSPNNSLRSFDTPPTIDLTVVPQAIKDRAVFAYIKPSHLICIRGC